VTEEEIILNLKNNRNDRKNWIFLLIEASAACLGLSPVEPK